MNTPETGSGGYVHRQMRCKLTGSFLYQGRRYRPGEYVEVALPPELAEFIEPAPPPKPVEAPEKPRALRIKPVVPKPGEFVRRLPGAPDAGGTTPPKGPA